MHDRPNFSISSFAYTVVLSVVMFSILFFGFFSLSYFSSKEGFFRMFTDVSFFIPSVLYFSFLFGWEKSYRKFFKFPESQVILIIGILIGALAIAYMGVSDHLWRIDSGQGFMSILDNLAGWYLFGIAGVAFQLYGLAFVRGRLFRSE